MYINILDEDKNLIDHLLFNNNTNFTTFKKFKEVPSIEKANEELIDSLDYLVTVFFPGNDGEFYLTYLDNKIIMHSNMDNNDLIGMKISSIFSDKNSKLLRILSEVFDNGIPQRVIFKYYSDNDILFRRFDVKIVRVNGFIYLLSKDINDYSSVLVEVENLFNNNIIPITIIQKGTNVKFNDKYFELFGNNNYAEFLTKNLNDINIINDSINYLNNKFYKVLNERISVYTFPFKVIEDNNLLFYFKITFEYIVYNGEPAVLCIFEDNTQQEVNRLKAEEKSKEALFLQKNLDLIQTATDTGISYYFNKKEVIRSSKLYDIIEREPLLSDKNKDLFYEFIIDEDLPLLKENYKKLKSGVGNINFIIRINTAKGNLKYIHCYLKEKYENDKLIEHISFYKDVTNEQIYYRDLKKALVESDKLKENLIHVQKISKTAISYTNNQGSLNWTPASYEMLKLNYNNFINYHGNFLDMVIDEDKHIWKEAYDKCTHYNPEATIILRIINGENNLAYIKLYIICYYDDENNHIGHATFYQDITEEVEKENELKESLNNAQMLERHLEKIQKISKTSLCFINDIDKDDVVWFSKGYSMLGYDYDEYSGTMTDSIYEEDRGIWIKEHQKCTPESPDISFVQRGIAANGEIKYIKTYVSYNFDENGKKISHVSFYQDVSDDIKRENQLKNTLKDKEILLTEVHHRVKNNLQIILSLINLNKNFDTNPDVILNDTENRIYAMALIHEKIYVSSSLSKINMKEYIESLVESLCNLYETNIQFHSKIKSIELNMEESIPIGLIINELVTNSIKYAFPNNKKGNLYIEFKKEYQKYTILVEDDGIGLPENFDINSINSMGLMVVENLTLQLGGTITISDCKGTGIKIEFYEEE